MKLTAIVVAIAVVAVPIAVQGAQAPTMASPDKRTCTVHQTLGSRVNNTRRCRPRSEREQKKLEARRTVDAGPGEQGDNLHADHTLVSPVRPRAALRPARTRSGGGSPQAGLDESPPAAHPAGGLQILLKSESR